MDNLAKGFVIGFSIAAPVGPIGLLCIRRSIADGRLAGFLSGLGAATADAVYGVVAALGLTSVTTFLVAHRGPVQLLGALFLWYFGVGIMRAKTIEATSTPVSPSSRTSRLLSAYTSTFLLTLSNPATILSFIGIFAGVGIGANAADAISATLLVVGVFLGSASWWLLLSTASSEFAKKMQTPALRWINRSVGVLLIAFGAWQLILLARRL